jgi:hypothetical protein
MSRFPPRVRAVGGRRRADQRAKTLRNLCPQTPVSLAFTGLACRSAFLPTRPPLFVVGALAPVRSCQTICGEGRNSAEARYSLPHATPGYHLALQRRTLASRPHSPHSTTTSCLMAEIFAVRRAGQCHASGPGRRGNIEAGHRGRVRARHTDSDIAEGIAVEIACLSDFVRVGEMRSLCRRTI